MTTVGPQFLLAFVPMVLMGLLFYGAIFYCLWKFYQKLSQMNDNLAGIRRALEYGGPNRPSLPQ
jgi:hypothetical protein